MNSSNNFINWLEGYLDATKNKLSPQQVKEIRRKIDDFREKEQAMLTPLWDSTMTDCYYPITSSATEQDSFLKEVEDKKNASTLDELS